MRNKKVTINSRRNFLLLIISLPLIYPLVKFIGFKIPKKPVYIHINSPMSGNDYLIHDKFILYDRDNRCWALSRKCTHLGCSVQYFEKEDIIQCPCHQSIFDPYTGKVKKGPAPLPLNSFPVEKRDTEPFYVITT